jgi:hypothetical protein
MLSQKKLSNLVLFLTCALTLGSTTSAFAVPSDDVAWSSEDFGITVYKDELDKSLFWYAPKLRFQSSKKTLADGTSGITTDLRPVTLANGNTEFSPRIEPYFPKGFITLVSRNIPGVDLVSQLRPITAMNIGVSLPEYKTPEGAVLKVTSVGGDATATSTNYEYLGIKRTVRFQLDPDQARYFMQDYQDTGVNVSFTISYAGVEKEKYYEIHASCEDMQRSLESGNNGSASGSAKGVYAGAKIQAAFLTANQTANNGVDIRTKGDPAELGPTLSTVLTSCFTLVAPATTTAADDDQTGYGNDDGSPSLASDILPKAKLQATYKLKKITNSGNRQSNVKQVGVKNAVSTMTLNGVLVETPAAPVLVKFTSAASKNVTVSSTNSKAAPMDTGIRINSGDQYAIQANYGQRQAGKPIAIDPTQTSMDEFLSYRIGNGTWKPVNQHMVITSDVANSGGALQFSLDLPKIKGSIVRPKGVFFTNINPITPEFTVQITGSKVGI